MAEPAHDIVVVGGGAGGLELVTALGKALGHRDRARITLVDQSLTHLWKPLLHQIAAGTRPAGEDEVNYLIHAKQNGFRFMLGSLAGLDRSKKLIELASMQDDKGEQMVPARSLSYSTLVIAIGSVSNDFGVSGVAEHCYFLDTRKEAERFHRHLLETCIRIDTRASRSMTDAVNVVIVGAGATGVELAAELREGVSNLVEFGLDRIDPHESISITLLEAGERILPQLPRRLSKAVAARLNHLDVKVVTGEQVTEVGSQDIRMASGDRLPADIVVWTAGIKAPDILRELDGLEANHIGQLVVHPSLQATRDDDVFAIGDCADCSLSIGDLTRRVPPRAQAVRQQAEHIVRTIKGKFGNRPPLKFEYNDYGSLVSLTSKSAIGALMGRILGRFTLEGWLARFAYRSLYRSHQLKLHGPIQTALLVSGQTIMRRTRPRLKLH